MDALNKIDAGKVAAHIDAMPMELPIEERCRSKRRNVETPAHPKLRVQSNSWPNRAKIIAKAHVVISIRQESQRTSKRRLIADMKVLLDPSALESNAGSKGKIGVGKPDAEQVEVKRIEL